MPLRHEEQLQSRLSAIPGLLRQLFMELHPPMCFVAQNGIESFIFAIGDAFHATVQKIPVVPRTNRTTTKASLPVISSTTISPAWKALHRNTRSCSLASLLTFFTDKYASRTCIFSAGNPTHVGTKHASTMHAVRAVLHTQGANANSKLLRRITTCAPDSSPFPTRATYCVIHATWRRGLTDRTKVLAITTPTTHAKTFARLSVYPTYTTRHTVLAPTGRA